MTCYHHFCRRIGGPRRPEGAGRDLLGREEPAALGPRLRPAEAGELRGRACRQPQAQRLAHVPGTPPHELRVCVCVCVCVCMTDPRRQKTKASNTTSKRLLRADVEDFDNNKSMPRDTV